MIQIIDTLLLKNTYFKKLSIADRISIYNEALKQVAELRKYFYTNQAIDKNFTINIPYILLSSIDSIDDILSDDLNTLTYQERLLIYNMVQSRIASLRNLQNHHYYLVNNTRGALNQVRKLSLPIIKSIRAIIEIIKEKVLQLPISKSIVVFTETVRTKVLSLPIAISIITGSQNQKVLQLPISNMIQLIGIFQERIKHLSLPIVGMINIIALGTTKIKTLTLPITKSITTVFAGVTIQQKILSLPIVKSIMVLESYQYSKEKQLTMPIIHSINTI